MRKEQLSGSFCIQCTSLVDLVFRAYAHIVYTSEDSEGSIEHTSSTTVSGANLPIDTGPYLVASRAEMSVPLDSRYVSVSAHRPLPPIAGSHVYSV